jgi:alanine-synthesizing transaminase
VNCVLADRTNWNLSANRLSQALAAHRASGKPLLDLTVSNPTQCGFTYDEQTVLRALANPAALRYKPDPRGMHSARAAVAGYYAKRDEQVPLDNIFLNTSTSEAYSFAFQLLCNPGDEVLMPAPGYPLFDFLADLHDVKLVRYSLLYDHGWQIDFHALHSAITARSRAIVVVNPNNPTGHYLKKSELQQLNEICAARGIALIADEVFLDFSVGTSAPPSLVRNEGALTFTTSGISKICGLPQMKAAWLIISGPAVLKSEATSRLEVIADTYLSMNAPVQLAMPVLLEQRQEFQRQLLSRVKANLAELDRQIALQDACLRLEIEGGWYSVIRLPASVDDEEFALHLLQKNHVHVHPGHFYDFAARNYAVLSLITPEETFANGVALLISEASRE